VHEREGVVPRGEAALLQLLGAGAAVGGTRGAAGGTRAPRAGGLAMKAILGLVIGALCAVAIACGGAQKSAAPPGPVMATDASTGGGPVMPGPQSEVDELSRQIEADLAKLGLQPQAAPPNACVQPPCDAVALSTDAAAQHTDDPSCKPAPSETCQSSCQLSDSICSNSKKICKIAGDLGGGDSYANGKCASGKASCTASRGRCCGCQP
jgi:hypothetical protein